jgi:tetratricopeptide (TPR) repeat protein
VTVATRTKRASHVEADRPLARRIGARLRHARLQASLTQAQLAAGRYTKAYVSALEHGLVKPSMAALNFFADRLQIPIERLLSDADAKWTRLDADLRLASGDWQSAVDAFAELLGANPPDHVRAELLLGLAEGLARTGKGEEAVRSASDAATLFRGQGRHADAAWATYWEASGLYEMEQGDQAAALLRDMLQEIGRGLVVEPDLPVRALIALATVASRDGEPERAMGYLEQARAHLDELDDRKHAIFLYSLALNYRELGDYEAAISAGTRSLAMFRASEAGFEAASIENDLAMVYLAIGSLDAAKAHAAQARDYFTRRDDQRWLAHVAETEGQIALAAGSTGDAVSLADEALRHAKASGNKKAEISSSLLLARAQRASGDVAAAAATLERAVTSAEGYGRRGQLQELLAEWSDVMAALGDLGQAYTLSRRAIDVGRR